MYHRNSIDLNWRVCKFYIDRKVSRKWNDEYRICRSIANRGRIRWNKTRQICYSSSIVVFPVLINEHLVKTRKIIYQSRPRSHFVKFSYPYNNVALNVKQS